MSLEAIDALGRLSVTHEVKGTPNYMTPEQADTESFGRTGAHPEVYALGGRPAAPLAAPAASLLLSVDADRVEVLSGEQRLGWASAQEPGSSLLSPPQLDEGG